MHQNQIKSRNDFPSLIDSMGLKKGVELGVWRGENSDFLLTNSSLEKLWSIDAWCDDTDKVKATFKNHMVKDGAIEDHYAAAKEALSKHGDRSEIIRGISWEHSPKFHDGTLDFIYIDASHRFSGVTWDLQAWWPKLRRGGVFAGHDYIYKYRYEVMEAVNGFMCEQQQILRITSNDIKDNGSPGLPSWWCIKEDIGRREWAELIKAAMPGLISQREELKAKGVHVVLPYQYYALAGMAIP